MADDDRYADAHRRARRALADTNVLAYTHDTSDVGRQPIAAQLLDDLWRSRDGVLSMQVLTEFDAVVTRKSIHRYRDARPERSSTRTQRGPSYRSTARR